MLSHTLAMPRLMFISFAKKSLHITTVPKPVILKGEKLQQIEGPNYTVLKNNNGRALRRK